MRARKLVCDSEPLNFMEEMSRRESAVCSILKISSNIFHADLRSVVLFRICLFQKGNVLEEKLTVVGLLCSSEAFFDVGKASVCGIADPLVGEEGCKQLAPLCVGNKGVLPLF